MEKLVVNNGTRHRECVGVKSLHAQCLVKCPSDTIVS